MSLLKWRDYFQNDIHSMHFEHAIACNSAEKPGVTDRAMTELLERVSCDFKGLYEKHLTE